MDKNIKNKNEIIIMRVGVVVIALIIFIFWVFNLKNVWRIDNENSINSIEEVKEMINEPVDNNLDLGDDFKKDAGELLDDLMDNVNGKVTTTPENNQSNCTKWINCMPTFSGEARPCQVPPGCEGITQIAY